EQVCQIEQYKQQILEQDGRKLSGEEAAMEWIENFADRFPR
ncbi:pilus assembly protein PilZ, partial [Candidatus Endoriftia persephone str. Guaymas]|nr:pilus assembly protein PilZ [Candidatus Endoriftia persephone str. Guaymas]